MQIYQWDMDTEDLIQKYDDHLAAVITIASVDKGRGLVSTSDDIHIRNWEYDTPVQIRYIAAPGMHSIPAITMQATSTSLVSPWTIKY